MDIAEAYMNAMIENEIFVKLHEAVPAIGFGRLERCRI